MVVEGLSTGLRFMNGCYSIKRAVVKNAKSSGTRPLEHDTR